MNTYFCSSCNHAYGEHPPNFIAVCPKCGKDQVYIGVQVQAEGLTASTGVSVVSMEGLANSDIFPSIILVACVRYGRCVEDGRIVESILPAWHQIADSILRDQSLIMEIDPFRWEEIIAGGYRKAGWNVTLTPRSGDFGRDVIAELQDGSLKIVEQVKRYSPGKLVGANDVRALLGVMTAERLRFPEMNVQGVLSTTSDFAPRVRTDKLLLPFISKDLHLLSGTDVLNRIRALK